MNLIRFEGEIYYDTAQFTRHPDGSLTINLVEFVGEGDPPVTTASWTLKPVQVAELLALLSRP